MANILIIDDEISYRRVEKAFLENAGYVVCEACDGKAGIEAFDREHPDLVVTNLRMPFMNGLAVLTAIGERSPATPVIVLAVSGDQARSDEVKNKSWGCLFKRMMDMNDLIAAVDLALAPHKRG